MELDCDIQVDTNIGIEGFLISGKICVTDLGHHIHSSKTLCDSAVESPVPVNN